MQELANRFNSNVRLWASWPVDDGCGCIDYEVDIIHEVKPQENMTKKVEFPIPLTHFEEFRKMWREADHAGKEQFNFHGHEVLTSYAKYVVEFEEPYAIAKGFIKK